MTAPTGIVTFLFTDLVSSTELLDRLGDDAAEVLHRTHFRLLRGAVASHGGQEVKSLGDGLMVVFPSVLDALACAVTMQQAVYRHNQREPGTPLNVRIGLHVGEPIRDEEDYFGTPVVTAKRLCDSAQSGQIIASQLVRGLIGSRGSFEFRELGSLPLKGLSQPVPACEVLWEAPAEEPLPALRLPAAFVIDEKTEAVGREREVATMSERLKEAAQGHGGVLLIGGEPGVGKSRLMREGARLANAEGWQVLLGHAYDSAGMPPYLPFVEALQAYVRACPLDGLKAQLGDDAPQVALVVPEVAQRLELAPGGRADAPRERYNLFESISDFLSAIAATAPAGLLICLEDLHWADESTLLLLEHAARRLAAERVLFLVTHRDSEADMTPALTRTVEQLTRQSLAQRLEVDRLAVDGVAALLANLGGREAPQSLTEAVYCETAGNPFFVREVFAYLVEERRLFDDSGAWRDDLRLDEIDVPKNVRLVIGRRLERVSEECRGVLVRAATIGRAFRFELLQAIAEIKDDSLLDTIEEAERSYLLRSDPDGRLSFTHELIRQTLLAGLSAPRRQRLHLRVAQALEELRAENIEPHIAELAEHYRRAGAAGSLDKAIDYSLRAGNIAQSLFALEEAESHWEAASDLMQTAGRPPKERADLLARLGLLVYSMGFDKYPRSIDFYSQALTLYEEAGDLENGANMHCAVGTVFASNTAAMDLSKARSHLLTAQRTLSSGPARPPQMRLYVQLSLLAHWQLHSEEGLAASERGMAIAEELGQPLLTSHSATVTPALIVSLNIGYGSQLIALGRLKDGFEAWARARQMAEEQNEALAGFLASVFPGVKLAVLGDPREGARILRDELRRPRQARTIRRRALLSFLGAALVVLPTNVVYSREAGGLLPMPVCGRA